MVLDWPTPEAKVAALLGGPGGGGGGALRVGLGFGTYRGFVLEIASELPETIGDLPCTVGFESDWKDNDLSAPLWIVFGVFAA